MTARLFALALLATFAVGCQQGGAAKTPPSPQKTEPVKKRELGRIVDKKGAPPRWFKTMKPAENGDRLVVIYRGTFANGDVFDSNDKPGDALMEFGLGEGGVIEGWDKGLVGVLPGEKITLNVPSEMAYGKGGTEGIPPNTDLKFVIQVVDIIKTGFEQDYAVIDVKKGTGPEVKRGSNVTIKYRVERPDGREVQDSFKANKTLSFKVGEGEIIEGVDLAIQGMRQGGIYEVYLPSRVSYRPSMEDGPNPNPFPTITKIQILSVK